MKSKSLRRPIKPSIYDIFQRIPFSKIRRYCPDIVICIERGGTVPAALITSNISLPLFSVKASLYNDEMPAKKIHNTPVIDLRQIKVKGKKVLLVDDVVKSGLTLSKVKDKILEQGAQDVKTFALYGKTDLSNTTFERCVVFPWQNTANKKHTTESRFDASSKNLKKARTSLGKGKHTTNS